MLGLAITVDGPLGPAYKVKPVVLHLASNLGWPIVPVSVASRRSLVFAKRWDRLEIPCPFTRVCFVVGEPIDPADKMTSREAV